MKVIETGIEGVLILEPRVFEDSRGYFFESFNQEEFEIAVGQVNFVQDNESKSSYGVIRGLHFQKGEYAQAKLVRVVKGSVLDVAVDIREGSPTFGKHVAVIAVQINAAQDSGNGSGRSQAEMSHSSHFHGGLTVTGLYALCSRESLRKELRARADEKR